MKKFTTRFLAAFLSVLMLISALPTSIFAQTVDTRKSTYAEFNGHYYKLYDSVCNSWEDAKEYCEKLGGYLAVINSAEENTAVYNYVTSLGHKNAYFGYSDSVTDGEWCWVNDNDSDYTNWHSNEPNQANTNEDYAMFYWKYTDGTWNDGDFTTYPEEMVFICEWDKVCFATEELQPAINNGNIICVADSKTGKALLNADVRLGSTTVKTDINGRAVFQADQEATGLTVTLNNYDAYSDPDFVFDGTSMIEYIQLNENVTKPKVTPVSCNGKSIVTGKAQINNKISQTAEIVVSGAAPNAIKQFSLKQDNKVLAANSTGTFQISNIHFKQGVPIVAEMTTEDGRKASETLNIDVASFDFTPADFPLSGISSIKLPDDAPLLGGVNFDLEIGKVGVECEITNDEVNVGFNIPVKDKDLSKLNNGLKKWMDDHNRKTPSSRFKFTLGGYAVIKMGSDGVKEVVGEIVIAASYKNGFGETFIVPVAIITIPVRVNVEFSVKGEAHITIIGYDLENAEWLLPKLDMSIKGGITASGGIGVSMASAGVYGKVGVGGDFAILPEIYVKKITGSGELGVYAESDFGFWSIRSELPLAKGEIVFYDRDRAETIANTYTSGSLYAADSYTVNDRSYLSSMSEFEAYAQSELVDGQRYATLQTSTYDGTNPQIVTANGITMMAYLRDNGGEDRYNFQQLVYSLWDDTAKAWEEPVPVDNNALVDADFCLESDGNNIWIAYTEANRALTEEDTLADTASVFEIVVARFDGSDFTEHTALTDNDCYDSSPVLAVSGNDVSVAWITNSQNDVFGMEGTNTISMSSYDGIWNTSDIASDVITVTALDLGFYENVLTVAAVHDADSDLYTSDDRILKTYANGVTTEITSGSCIANPTVTSDAILWYENSAIYSTKSSEPIFPLNADCSSEFQLTDNAILFTIHNTEGENGGSDIWCSFLQADGTYGAPVRITRTGKYVDSFGAVTYNGGFLIPFRETEVAFTEDSFITDSSLCSMIYTQNHDLCLESVNFDLDDLTDDGTVTFTAYVTNTGAMDIVNPQLLVNDILIGTISQTIPAGESAEITFTYTVPEDTSSVTLSVCDADEMYLADNIQAVQLAHADIVVNAEQKIIADKNYLLVTMINTGSDEGSGTLTIFEGNADGTAILSEKYSLDAGQSTYALYPMDDERFRNYRDSLLFVRASTSEEDYNAANNSDTVEMLSFHDWSVALSSETTGDVLVEVSAPENANASTLIVAQYNNGQMIDVQTFDLLSDVYSIGEYSTDVTFTEIGDTYRAFLVDENYNPLCDVAVLSDDDLSEQKVSDVRNTENNVAVMSNANYFYSGVSVTENTANREIINLGYTNGNIAADENCVVMLVEGDSQKYTISDDTVLYIDQGITVESENSATVHFEMYPSVKKNCVVLLSGMIDGEPKQIVLAEVTVIDVAYGDVNADLVINSKDIISIKMYLSGSIDINQLLADVNKDGAVNSDDIAELARQISKS